MRLQVNKWCPRVVDHDVKKVSDSGTLASSCLNGGGDFLSPYHTVGSLYVTNLADGFI